MMLRCEDKAWLKQQILFKTHMIKQGNPGIKDIFLPEVALLKGPYCGR